MNMFKKFSKKAIPLAAMTAALMFGAAAHAQTGSAGMTNAPTDIGGTTKGKDAVTPDPRASTGMKASPDAAGATSSGSGMSSGTMAPPGTTKGKDKASPEPTAGRNAGGTAGATESADLTPADPNASTAPGTSKGKNNVSPSPTAGKAMTAEERAAAKAEKKAASDAKREARMNKSSSGSMGMGGQAAPSGGMGMGSPSPSGDTGGMAPSTAK